MTSFGPVSQELEQQLKEQVQRNKLIIWLDSGEHYTDFADELIQQRADGGLNYEVKAFRGSYLELLLELQDLTGGVGKKPLVIHLPGFNTTNITSTPMLELYKAGTVFQKALPTLITDAAATQLPTEQIESFLQTDNLALLAADNWLKDALQDDGSGLTGHLRNLNLTILIYDLLAPDGYVPRQLRDAKGKQREQIVAEVNNRLASLTGASLTGSNDDWLQPDSEKRQLGPVDIASNAVSWALCVEYVVDLIRPPIQQDLKVAESLPDAVRNECCRLAADLRQNQADFYRSTALDTQDRLQVEREQAVAEDLGKIDTFPFEEDKILEAALQATREGQWTKAIQWADDRSEDQSFWQRGDSSRSDAWILISRAANLGQAIANAGSTLGDVASLEAALERYTAVGSRVDQSHRQLEQTRSSKLIPGIQKFAAIRSVLDSLRQQWRIWADQWATDFNELCLRKGFLPRPELQQRRIFDDVVRTSVNESSITALFLIDGMRYEMAQELYDDLQGTPKTTIKLDARFAELPTITSVGMNVLAPVDSGNRLQPAIANGKFQGFSTGSFRVKDPETRKRAMRDRVGGSKCPWKTLKEVLDSTKGSLKQAIAGARLMVVDSKEIDESGHGNVGPEVFAQKLQHIKAAWKLLRDVGVQNFVITSDHGFLYLPQIDQPAQKHGRIIDPKGRHVISETVQNFPGEVSVPLRSLDYDCDDLHLVFPLTVIPFDRGKADRHFVHGGNSFQERVIPVMTIRHAVARGANNVKYQIEAVAAPAAFGMNHVKATLVLDKSTFGFECNERVELIMQAVDEPDVTVDIQEVIGGAELETNTIVARVGQEFQVFFRLSSNQDKRVRVQLVHPTGLADVTPAVISERFEVAVVQGRISRADPEESGTTDTPKAADKYTSGAAEWLAELPSDAIRSVFAHLNEHGVITEDQVTGKLGNQRATRRFSRQFDELAKLAPFPTRIESIDGVKRYIKDGGAI